MTDLDHIDAHRVLVISVHPDDETLGCGGTLLHHRARGHEIHWMVVTQPFEPDYPAAMLGQAAQQVTQVAAAFGMAQVHKLGFPTAQLDTVGQADLIQKFRNVIAGVRPAIVYLVHSGDVHSDHRAAFDAALSVLKPFHMQALGVRRILSYETLSSTEAAPPMAQRAFVPNVYQDITGYLDRKLAIMALYQTESQSDLFPRGASAIRALARYRGATIGVEYAEAFMLIREIDVLPLTPQAS